MQSSLPVVRQLQSQSQDQFNMVFVGNVVMKMGLPLFMADNEGFREWLAMLNPKFQHRKSLSLLLKQIATASFEKLKVEIKVSISTGSKVVLAIDAWTGQNIQSI